MGRESLNIAMKLRPSVFVVQPSNLSAESAEFISTLAKVGKVQQTSANNVALKDCSEKILSKDVAVYIETKGMIDYSSEIKKLQKEIGQGEKKLAGLEKKPSNKNFLAKAKPEIIQKFQSQYDDLKIEVSKMQETLGKYKQMA